MASGGSEASSLAETSVVARITSAVTASAETAEQFGQADPRKVNQMTSGTTAICAASIVARTASSEIARTTIRNDVARTAIANARATETNVLERVQASQ